MPEIDNDKLDFVLHARVNGSVLRSPAVGAQVKCEISGVATADPIPFPVDLETYDNLRDPTHQIPRILLLVLAPQDPTGWISQTEQELALSHCGYWLSLKNAPASSNSTQHTVYLPRANIFSASALEAMMQRVGNGLDI